MKIFEILSICESKRSDIKKALDATGSKAKKRGSLRLRDLRPKVIWMRK